MKVTARLIQISNTLDRLEKTAIRPRPKARPKKRTYRDYAEEQKAQGRRPLTEDQWKRRVERQPGWHLMEEEESEP